MATLVLCGSFLVMWVLKLFGWDISYPKIGRYSMSIMLVFFGFSHFFMPEDLMAMIPPIFPFPLLIVYVTGVMEIVFAILLLFRKTYAKTGILLILYFLCVWPANIYNALNTVDIPGGIEQYIPYYHWIRVILIQPFFMGWTWWSTKESKEEKGK